MAGDRCHSQARLIGCTASETQNARIIRTPPRGGGLTQHQVANGHDVAGG